MTSDSDFYNKIKTTIDRAGHQILGIMGGGKEPDFAYTIGLSPKHGYELIVFGLPHHHAKTIINSIVTQIIEPGLLQYDTPIDTITNMPLKFMPCTPAMVKDYGIQAFRYYQKSDIPFVQVVLCDREGFFPGDPQYDHGYMDDFQAVLYPFQTGGIQ